MKSHSLYWVGGTGAVVMVVIAALMAAQPKAPPAASPVAMAGISSGGAPAARSLWCGLAFGVVTADVPGDSDETRDIVRRYADAGTRLLADAKAAYVRAGHSPAAFEAHAGALVKDVAAAVNTTGRAPEFSFEECTALVGL